MCVAGARGGLPCGTRLQRAPARQPRFAFTQGAPPRGRPVNTMVMRGAEGGTGRSVRGPCSRRLSPSACALSGAGAARRCAAGGVLARDCRVCVSSGDFIRELCSPCGARTPPAPPSPQPRPASSARRSRCSTVWGGTTIVRCSANDLAFGLLDPYGALIAQRRAVPQVLADPRASHRCCAPTRTPPLAALCRGGTCGRDNCDPC